MYSKVFNIQEVWNSRDDWKKYLKLIVVGEGEGRKLGGWKKMKSLMARCVGGWGGGGAVGVTFKLLFFFSFLTMKTTVLRTFEYTVKVK